MLKKIFFLSLVFLSFKLFSQNTLGTVLLESSAAKGYTLFTTHKSTYLINNCGQVINTWTSEFLPGNAVYLLPNGNLLRAGRSSGQSNITIGGSGGNIELFNWEGEKIWSYSVNEEGQRQHHDVFPMSNGNILILIAENWEEADAIQAGRNPDKIFNGLVYNEKILEVKPIGTNEAEEIWEWNIIDHLVQDFDDTKDNFGVVSDFPNKLDVNFINSNDVSSNWLHVNSIQYNEQLDQIVLSSRNLSEIWIIDHSTTTIDSASDSGGNFGKGGDLLYRWGNPQSYQRGTESDRQLFGQHYPYIIEEGTKDEGKIIVFNNGNGRSPSFSEVLVIDPPLINNTYEIEEGFSFGPENPDYIYSEFEANATSNFYSAILSGAQRLKNGNTLICEGVPGNIFEVDEKDNIVWQYIVPVVNNNGTILSQGDTPEGNRIFRAYKYSEDYEAFVSRDLSPKNPIEKNFNLDACATLNTNNLLFNKVLTISPNPSSGIFKINFKVDKITIYDSLGKEILEVEDTNKIDLYNYSKGLYFIKILKEGKATTRKIIKN